MQEYFRICIEISVLWPFSCQPYIFSSSTWGPGLNNVIREIVQLLYACRPWLRPFHGHTAHVLFSNASLIFPFYHVLSKYQAAFPKSLNQSRTISTFMAQDDPQHDNPFLTSVTSFSTPLARTAKVPKADGCIDSCRMIAWFCQLAWQVWHEDCLWHHRWLQGLRDGWPMGYLAEHWQYRRCHRVFGCAF